MLMHHYIRYNSESEQLIPENCVLIVSTVLFLCFEYFMQWPDTSLGSWVFLPPKCFCSVVSMGVWDLIVSMGVGHSVPSRLPYLTDSFCHPYISSYLKNKIQREICSFNGSGTQCARPNYLHLEEIQKTSIAGQSAWWETVCPT